MNLGWLVTLCNVAKFWLPQEDEVKPEWVFHPWEEYAAEERQKRLFREATICRIKNKWRHVNGFTVLMCAIDDNEPVDEIKWLIRLGSDVNHRTKDGLTPLALALDNQNSELAMVLIEAGAEVNQADNDGVTPLYWAAEDGRTEMVKMLLDRHADVSKAKNGGWTPLHGAAFWGRTETVKALLKARADVNKADKYGYTPLYWAVEEGHTEIVKALLEAGAKVSQPVSDGKTLLHNAIENGHTETADLLRLYLKPWKRANLKEMPVIVKQHAYFAILALKRLGLTWEIYDQILAHCTLK